MRVTLIILTDVGQEIARITFPNKEIFMQTNWIVSLPWSYAVEWDEE